MNKPELRSVLRRMRTEMESERASEVTSRAIREGFSIAEVGMMVDMPNEFCRMVADRSEFIHAAIERCLQGNQDAALDSEQELSELRLVEDISDFSVSWRKLHFDAALQVLGGRYLQSIPDATYENHEMELRHYLNAALDMVEENGAPPFALALTLGDVEEQMMYSQETETAMLALNYTHAYLNAYFDPELIDPNPNGVNAFTRNIIRLRVYYFTLSKLYSPQIAYSMVRIAFANIVMAIIRSGREIGLIGVNDAMRENLTSEDKRYLTDNIDKMPIFGMMKDWLLGNYGDEPARIAESTGDETARPENVFRYWGRKLETLSIDDILMHYLGITAFESYN